MKVGNGEGKGVFDNMGIMVEGREEDVETVVA